MQPFSVAHEMKTRYGKSLFFYFSIGKLKSALQWYESNPPWRTATDKYAQSIQDRYPLIGRAGRN
jgi:hypothetical protein